MSKTASCDGQPPGAWPSGDPRRDSGGALYVRAMPIARAGMLIGQAGPSAAEQLFAQRAFWICRLETAATLKFRYHQFDDVRERLRGDGVGQIETVEIGG